MPHDLDELRKLATEAARETYSPLAQHCWPWSHKWTKWQPFHHRRWLECRECLRCGRSKVKPIRF